MKTGVILRNTLIQAFNLFWISGVIKAVDGVPPSKCQSQNFRRLFLYIFAIVWPGAHYRTFQVWSKGNYQKYHLDNPANKERKINFWGFMDVAVASNKAEKWEGWGYLSHGVLVIKKLLSSFSNLIIKWRAQVDSAQTYDYSVSRTDWRLDSLPSF